MDYFSTVPLSTVTGAALGAWLIVAAALKLIGPAGLPADVEDAVPSTLRWVLKPFALWVLPGMEIIIGLAAHLAPDIDIVRWSVLILFGLFFLVIARLAMKSAHFNCGCMGSYRTSSRRVGLSRGVAGMSMAMLFFASPVGPALPSAELVWLHSLVWSVIATTAVIRMAHQFSSDVHEEAA
jgi:hypothetical protein